MQAEIRSVFAQYCVPSSVFVPVLTTTKFTTSVRVLVRKRVVQKDWTETNLMKELVTECGRVRGSRDEQELEVITTPRAEEMRRGMDFQNLGSKLWLKKGTPPVAIVKEHSQCQPTAHKKAAREPHSLPSLHSLVGSSTSHTSQTREQGA